MIARIAAALFLLLTPVAGYAQDRIINYEPDDPEMNRAIEDALRTLPMFLDALSKGVDTDFVVKVPLPHAKGRELIWMGNVRVEGDEFTGRIANNPVHQRKIRKGDPFRVKQSAVVDWYFMRDGKMHGSYTTRVMLARMPPEQAERLRAILAPLP